MHIRVQSPNGVVSETRNVLISKTFSLQPSVYFPFQVNPGAFVVSLALCSARRPRRARHVGRARMHGIGCLAAVSLKTSLA